jgi:tetratricopeptide (TPR) repeat protein
MTEARSQPIPWLFGPWPDLLFGCGLLYALAFGVFLVAGAEIRSAQPSLLFPLLILALGVPHYGATLLRVYERRRERHAYVLFTLWATLAIAALFLASLRLPALATFLVTLYLTWSPWHYTGQNYGLAVMFLRRGGVALEPGTKRWLHLSFLLSFLLVFLQMHTGTAPMSDLPLGYTSEQGAVFVPLGIPWRFALALAGPLGVVYLLALAVVALRLRRQAAWRALLPPALLAVSQLLWFSLPYALHLLGVAPQLDPLSWKFRSHYFTWIAAAHFLQYLWVTAYYARQSGGWRGHAQFYGKSLLAGAAPWTLPFLVVGPQALGPLSADAGLAMLVASAVNLHHFVLDGAIWKLRGRIAEVLIRSGSDVEDAAPVARRLGLRHAVWAACAVALAVNLSQLVDEELYRRSFARGDLRAARAASERLARVGFDRGSVHLALGQALLREGRPAEARDELWRSLELAPTATAHVVLGKSFERERLWARAADAYETALAAGLPREDAMQTLGLAANAWLEARQPERALALLERAPPGDPRFQQLSERAQQASAGAPPSS